MALIPVLPTIEPNLAVTRSHTMPNAFYVFPRHGGFCLFASDLLSDCLDFASQYSHVEVVDMFGQVWR